MCLDNILCPSLNKVRCVLFINYSETRLIAQCSNSYTINLMIAINWVQGDLKNKVKPINSFSTNILLAMYRGGVSVTYILQ